MTLQEMHIEWQALEAERKARPLTAEETEAHRMLGVLLGNAKDSRPSLDDLSRQVRAAGQDEIPTSPSMPVTHATTPAPPPRTFPTDTTLRIHEARVEEALSKLEAITDDQKLADLKHEARELLTVLYGLASAAGQPRRGELVAMSPEEKAALYRRINQLCDTAHAVVALHSPKEPTR